MSNFVLTATKLMTSRSQIVKPGLSGLNALMELLLSPIPIIHTTETWLVYLFSKWSFIMPGRTKMFLEPVIYETTLLSIIGKTFYIFTRHAFASVTCLRSIKDIMGVILWIFFYTDLPNRTLSYVQALTFPFNLFTPYLSSFRHPPQPS